MSGSQELVPRARRRLAALIAPTNTREGKEQDASLVAASSHFYAQQESCQIDDLWYLLETFLGQREDGVFVEVGAFDGVTYSNTWGLAQRGWIGVLVEPVAAFASMARAAHADHPRVSVMEVAVGSAPGVVTLMSAGALTTGNVALSEQYKDVAWARRSLTSESVSVTVTTLSALIAAHLDTAELDLLVVDVEGFEREVFDGFDWSARPKMLIVELADVHPDLTVTRATDALLLREIQGRGYEIAFKDRVNTVFVRDDVWSAALIGETHT